jgi:hypothetical protein
MDVSLGARVFDDNPFIKLIFEKIGHPVFEYVGKRVGDRNGDHVEATEVPHGHQDLFPFIWIGDFHGLLTVAKACRRFRTLPCQD